MQAIKGDAPLVARRDLIDWQSYRSSQRGNARGYDPMPESRARRQDRERDQMRHSANKCLAGSQKVGHNKQENRDFESRAIQR